MKNNKYHTVGTVPKSNGKMEIKYHTMISDSLDCTFLIAPSVFSNVYFPII
jgi:hypothetical protein